MSKKFTNLHDATCAYPFLYDDDSRVEFEIHTDMMCSRLGLILALLKEFPKSDSLQLIILELSQYHEKLYDLNGSLRGRNTIFPDDVQELIKRYELYQELIKNDVQGFLLPSGNPVVMECHLLRCEGKKLVRILYQVEKEGFLVPQELFDYANVFSNYIFALSCYLMKLFQIPLIPYYSENYGK